MSDEERAKPVLHAVVLDFTAVSSIDTTAVQALIDSRGEIERWADREVTFHFCHILSPWIRRGLVAGGFGLASDERKRANVPIEIAPIAGPINDSDDHEFSYRDLRRDSKDVEAIDETVQPNASAASSATDFEGSLVSTATPYFHFDLSSAVAAAEAEVEVSRPSPPTSVARSVYSTEKGGL